MTIRAFPPIDFGAPSCFSNKSDLIPVFRRKDCRRASDIIIGFWKLD
jgi:hypothetical protein